jgi:hypothetical protein
MTTENNNQNNDGTGGEKLYAGKFKTVEELENGYKASLPTFQENENLKKKVDELSKVPDTYMNPADVEIDAPRVANLQQRAKDANMTQAQYEKFVRSEKAALDARQANFEKARKDVGEETLNILKEYVTKNYPQALADNMLNTFIGNKEARDAALAHRAQLLNNQVPGMNKPSQSGYTVTHEDVQKAYAAKEKNPGDMKARQHYLNVVAAQAAQKQAS